jgi:hypothetical protein
MVDNTTPQKRVFEPLFQRCNVFVTRPWAWVGTLRILSATINFCLLSTKSYQGWDTGRESVVHSLSEHSHKSIMVMGSSSTIFANLYCVYGNIFILNTQVPNHRLAPEHNRLKRRIIDQTTPDTTHTIIKTQGNLAERLWYTRHGKELCKSYATRG